MCGKVTVSSDLIRDPENGSFLASVHYSVIYALRRNVIGIDVNSFSLEIKNNWLNAVVVKVIRKQLALQRLFLIVWI